MDENPKAGSGNRTDKDAETIDLARRGDKYGIQALALRIIERGNALRETGRLVEQIEGTQLASALLDIESQIGLDESLSKQIREFLREYARREFNRCSIRRP